MLMDEEGLKETANKLMHMGRHIEIDDEAFKRRLMDLKEACEKDEGRIKQVVGKIVSTYVVNEG